MDDDTNDDTVTVQEAFERGHVESLMNVVEDYDSSTDDISNETQELVEDSGDEYPTREKEEHPDTLTICVPLDDRHGPMVSDIQDAGVSVEQQFIEDREFMMGVEQRIHGLFLSLKYSDGERQ